LIIEEWASLQEEAQITPFQEGMCMAFKKEIGFGPIGVVLEGSGNRSVMQKTTGFFLLLSPFSRQIV
jgi:hypothetical protein